MAYVKFNRAAYEACDPVAKDIISKYLNKLGYFTLAEEKRDADVKAASIHSNSVGCDYEVSEMRFYEGEIKSGWQGEWPKSFNDVHIPERKAKLLEKHKGFTLKFWVISGDLKKAWEIDSQYIREEFLKEVPNTRYSSGEKFFCVPLEYCTLINLEDI